MIDISIVTHHWVLPTKGEARASSLPHSLLDVQTVYVFHGDRDMEKVGSEDPCCQQRVSYLYNGNNL
jgi:hypothetical protein